MWPYRRRSTTTDHNYHHHHQNNHNNNDDCSPKSRRAPSSPNFRRQSLKDIDTLTHDDHSASNFTSFAEKPAGCSRKYCAANVANIANIAGEVSRPSVFHRVHLANRFTRAFSARPKPESQDSLSPKSIKSASPSSDHAGIGSKSGKRAAKFEQRVTIPGSEKRVVVYMTSLRAVRSTFEACRTVRSILQGFRVPVDERDLMMDSSFSDEIRKIMAQIGRNGSGEKRVTLPRVFIGGRYIGGVDEIVELHEIGELKKFVSGLPAVTPGVCEICGGFRFILCNECNGSHKCPLEDCGFRACTICNENGLIRCPSCLCC